MASKKKAKPASTKSKKPAPRRKVVAKKTAKKTVKRKATPKKKAVKKPLKKVTPKKSVKKPSKKATAKKSAKVKKAVPKKTPVVPMSVAEPMIVMAAEPETEVVITETIIVEDAIPSDNGSSM